MGLEKVAEFNLGRHVECDACGLDLTDDTRTGGLLFGSKGYGPCCSERMMASIRGYGEEEYIRGTCPDGVSFADWIRGMRSQIPGGNTVRIYGGPS
jgi:hypothetical protein